MLAELCCLHQPCASPLPRSVACPCLRLGARYFPPPCSCCCWLDSHIRVCTVYFSISQAPAHFSLWYACAQDAVEMLLKAGADTSTVDSMGYTALFEAVRMGNDGCISQMLKYNAKWVLLPAV
eukprot:scaffold22890_cov21-Tisochrysis_lutea.AAC.1